MNTKRIVIKFTKLITAYFIILILTWVNCTYLHYVLGAHTVIIGGTLFLYYLLLST